jgi:hypothetical protein
MTLLQTETPASTEPPVAIERIVWAGPATVMTSIAAVLAARVVLVQLPGVHGDSVVLGWIAPAADTAILCTFAVIVFIAVNLSSDSPVRTFRRIAFGALLISFVPLAVVATGNLNGNRPTALALAVLHITAYVPCVTLLPALMRGRAGEPTI